MLRYVLQIDTRSGRGQEIKVYNLSVVACSADRLAGKSRIIQAVKL